MLVRAPGPRGFTLVELMVVIAVIAVTLTLAVPGAASMSANYRVRSAAEGLLGGLNYARVEAVRRNTPVRFALAGGAGWTVEEVATSTVLQSRAAGGAVNATPDGAALSVTFMPTGLVASGTHLRQVTVSSVGAGEERRQINIFGGGLLRMCDPASTSAGDPRRC